MSLHAQILSLNIGHPEYMPWQGKQILSSMHKKPTPGPLVVHQDRIEGNTFASPEFHGAIHSVLYAYGVPSAQMFMKLLGQDRYEPGAAGETLTLDNLDETDVSVGDIFQIGEVIAQATYPRIPCGKVDYRMQHKNGRRAMVECGRSGIYFRIIKPGLIHQSDLFKRTERSKYSFTISRLYELVNNKQRPTDEELNNAKRNPAFLQMQIQKWESV